MTIQEVSPARHFATSSAMPANKDEKISEKFVSGNCQNFSDGVPLVSICRPGYLTWHRN